MRKNIPLFIFFAALTLFGCKLAEVGTETAVPPTAIIPTAIPAATVPAAANPPIVPSPTYPAVDPDSTITLSGGQPRTLDPAITHGGPSGALGHIFSGLITLDAELQIQPELAAGWDISDDGLTYIFYLRKNGAFHDGTPVTTYDVIYSWERATDPATNSATAQTYLGDIAGVNEKLRGEADTISGLRAIDEYTLEVTLAEPVVYFLSKLAYPVAFVLDEKNVAQPDWEHHPNGSGPFRLLEWKDDEIMVLERNAAYYLEPARVQKLIYWMGAGFPLSLYETGEIDMVSINNSTLERVQDPNDPLAGDVQIGVSMCTSTIGLNNSMPPFDDVRVRQAFNYAINKELLIELFFGGNALPAHGSLPPGMPGYNADLEGYPFNPERARELLAEAGYPNGEGFPVVTYSTSGYGEVGEYVTAVITQWQENLNVKVAPLVIDPYTFYDELYSGNVGNIYGSGWCADYPDPQNFLDILYHTDSPQNIGRFSDPAIDKMLEEARIETDAPTRLALYADIEKRIVEEAPVVFTTHSINAVLVNPELKGYTLAPIGVRQWHRVTK